MVLFKCIIQENALKSKSGSFQTDPRELKRNQKNCIQSLQYNSDESSDDEFDIESQLLKPKLPIETMFNLRHTNMNPFEIKPDTSKETSYFSLDGKPRPKQINEIGEYPVYNPKIKKSDVEGAIVREDEIAKLSESRSIRIAAFQSVTTEIIKAEDEVYHNLDEVFTVLDDDVVVQRLQVTEIEGLPTNTTVDFVKGSIEVALIQNSKTKLMQLHFSVVEGTATIKVKESFKLFEFIQRLFIFKYLDCTACLKYFKNCCGLKYLPGNSNGSYDFDYQSKIDFANQYGMVNILKYIQLIIFLSIIFLIVTNSKYSR